MTLPVDSNNDILSLVYSLKSIINNFETKDIDESNKNIILNARGFKFKVIPYKFDKFPRSRLAKIFERLKRKNKSELLKFCDDISPDFNEIYFDRDPFFFNKTLIKNLLFSISGWPDPNLINFQVFRASAGEAQNYCFV